MEPWYESNVPITKTKIVNQGKAQTIWMILFLLLSFLFAMISLTWAKFIPLLILCGILNILFGIELSRSKSYFQLYLMELKRNGRKRK